MSELGIILAIIFVGALYDYDQSSGYDMEHWLVVGLFGFSAILLGVFGALR